MTDMVQVVARATTTLPCSSACRDRVTGELLHKGKTWAALTLRTGVNDVPADYWAWCRKREDVQAQIGVGRIGEAGSAAAVAKEQADANSKKPDSETGLKDLTVGIAKTFIHACDDVATLRRWHASEKRQPLRSECQRRIKDVEGRDPDAGDNS